MSFLVGFGSAIDSNSYRGTFGKQGLVHGLHVYSGENESGNEPD